MYCELPKLGRCCFCLPLRRGLLIIGYMSLLFSIIGVIVYSTRLHMEVEVISMTFDGFDILDDKIIIGIYAVDIIFSIILIYGAHRKMVKYIKIYYYYTLAVFVLMILSTLLYLYMAPNAVSEFVTMSTTKWCLYFYVVLVVRSFLEKLENTTDLKCENQIHEVIDVEIKKDNAVYPNLPAETV